MTIDHTKGETPRHLPNPNLGDGKYADIQQLTASMKKQS